MRTFFCADCASSSPYCNAALIVGAFKAFIGKTF